jgi:hypothetical protein
LAAIIEIAGDQTYPEFTKEHLFKPAGMKDTGFFGEPYDEERMALGYGPRSDGKINAPPHWGKTSWLVMGSGGQVSTALDMWRWVQAVHGGKLLSPESLKLYGSGKEVLAGGDMYGFSIVYAGNHRTCMILMSNARSPKAMRQMRNLEDALAGLIVERTLLKYTLGVQLDIDDKGRVKIAGVAPGSPAEKGGLREGDSLIKVGDKEVGPKPLEVIGAALASGQVVEIVYERGGKRDKVSIKPVTRR